MSALTIKGIPDEVLDGLRTLAEKERRSMNQQAIVLLEKALAERRPSFSETHAAFIKKYGPPPIDDDTFAGLRSKDTGRPPPFGEDFFTGEDADSAPGAED